ncbi:MAG: pantothenate kinase [Microcoleaceae cyanobacterium MO_207.B10]|nr:pantothenate kinase [Microcoleaceae cyanobacterium MO_207.B10]
MFEQQPWLGLMIGNSRLHLGLFVKTILRETWDIDHVQEWEIKRGLNGEREIEKLLKSILEKKKIKLHSGMPLLIASVVSQQTAIWQTYPQANIITLDRLPLQGVYSTLGIDRALAVLGAGTKLGWPVLVIDAGTAITFTGADGEKNLVGGAILPGLRLQLSALAAGTAMLPLTELPAELPHRWAKQTTEAIQSGVLYTVLAGMANYIEAWREEFPDSKVVLTGGDRTLLLTNFKATFPELAATVIDAPEVIFWGMAKVWQQIFS